MFQPHRQPSRREVTPQRRPATSMVPVPLRGGAARTRSGSHRRTLVVLSSALVLLVGFGLYLGPQKPVQESVVVVIAEKTSRAPGRLDDQVLARIHALSDIGGGQVVTFAVGEVSSALRPVQLAVLRDGASTNDSVLRRAAIANRLSALTSDLDAAQVGREGFNLVAALQAAEAESSRRPDQRLEVWLQTTVLTSSSDPLRLSALIAADPKAAVEEVISRTELGKLDLSRVDLHPVLVSPVGSDQPPLSVAAEAWRSEFLAELGEALGATVHTPVRSGSLPTTPWAAAATAPPILLLRADPTPDPLPAPAEALPEVIDTAGFAPNTASLLDPDALGPKVTRLVGRYKLAEGRYVIQVKGFTAAFGSRETSLALSADRARVVGDLLVAAGVPADDISTRGVGFDERANPTQPPQAAAQRVVIVRLVERPT